MFDSMIDSQQRSCWVLEEKSGLLEFFESRATAARFIYRFKDQVADGEGVWSIVDNKSCIR